ncbi:MAG: acyltransferase [Bacteroidota bacterium]|nr:acyltransferase [Bacteroidota bacterium]
MNLAFDDIRPYNDPEAVAALRRVATHPVAAQISRYLFPELPETTLSEILNGVTGVDDFQHKVMDPAVRRILETTTTAFSFSFAGTENLPEGCHLFLSNHRDIVLDPAITQEVLVQCNLPTTEICVGDNLLSDSLVEDLIRSNRMVKVKRGISGRELYDALATLSIYIRESITTGRSSVWLAQRQGRTKDGRDGTEEALIKMLGMSGTADFAETYKALRIVPLSISYELEPCDILKARETLIKESGVKYVKQPGEDLHSILTGIRQPKGRVHLQFGKALTDAEIDTIAALPRPERAKALCALLDERIDAGYRLWDTNYIARDILDGNEAHAEHYSPASKAQFLAYMEHQLASVAGQGLDPDALRDRFLRIYAGPVREE